MLIETNSPNTTDIHTAQSPSNGGTNANQKDNLSYSTEPIEGTPFTLVKNEKEEYMVRMGRYAIMHWVKNKKEAMIRLPKGDMMTLCTLISAIAEQVYEHKQLMEDK